MMKKLSFMIFSSNSEDFTYKSYKNVSLSLVDDHIDTVEADYPSLKGLT